ncbi:MAG: hypothetical protein ACPHO8_02340 [Mariniblastus sp.]
MNSLFVLTAFASVFCGSNQSFGQVFSVERRFRAMGSRIFSVERRFPAMGRRFFSAERRCPVTERRFFSVEHSNPYQPIFNGENLDGWYAIKTYDPRSLSKMDSAAKAKRIADAKANTSEFWRVENGEIINDGKGPFLTSERVWRLRTFN